jgi:two-component system, sensor histidine kinase and response regulator
MENDKKILVVEDSDVQRTVCVEQLQIIGLTNIFEAENGVEALEVLKNNTVDLILSDWDMPKMDGLELLKTLKKDSELQNTPFIFLTVHDDEDKNREAMVYGAVDYIVKPSTPGDLKESIEIIFNRGIRNILIVEDSELQKEICIVQLQQIGFENITGAANGIEALDHLEHNPVDLIVSDWEMPEMDGLGLLKAVKDNDKLRDIPFLILTVHDDPKKNQEALNLGALDFIVKPSTPDSLHMKIRKILY